LDAVVIQIVLQATITGFEHKVILDEGVFEHLNHVVDVKVVALGKDKRVPHKLLHAGGIVILHEVVEGVGCVDLVMLRILQDRRVKGIERNKVAHFTSLLILDKPSVNNIGARYEEMTDLCFTKFNVDLVVIGEVLVESYGDFCYVRFSKGSETVSGSVRWQLVLLVEFRLCNI